jgi:hypothetical protein
VLPVDPLLPLDVLCTLVLAPVTPEVPLSCGTVVLAPGPDVVAELPLVLVFAVDEPLLVPVPVELLLEQ